MNTVQIIEGPSETHDGVACDVWHVSIDGQTKTLVTSPSSMAVMREIVGLYHEPEAVGKSVVGRRRGRRMSTTVLRITDCAAQLVIFLVDAPLWHWLHVVQHRVSRILATYFSLPVRVKETGQRLPRHAWLLPNDVHSGHVGAIAHLAHLVTGAFSWLKESSTKPARSCPRGRSTASIIRAAKAAGAAQRDLPGRNGSQDCA
jgi:hypothetical protein